MRNLEVPKKYQRLYEKAASGHSRKAAIRVHCLMCVGWLEQEVNKCTSPDCPMFRYRLPTPAPGGGQAGASELKLAGV